MSLSASQTVTRRMWRYLVSEETAASARADLPPFAALTLSFLALYTGSIDLDARNLMRFNFLLDADILRVVLGFKGETALGHMRHPLFPLFFGGLGARLESLGIDGAVGARAVSATAGALAVGLAYLTLLPVVRRRLDALMLAALFGVTSSLWLLSSIPETFAINALVIVLSFWLQSAAFAWPVRHPLRFAGYVVYTVVALGIALPNLVYAFLGYLNNVRRTTGAVSGRAVSVAAYTVASLALLAALSSVQTSWYPETYDRLARFPDEMLELDRFFIDFNRPLSAADLGNEARELLLDGVVGRRPAVTNISSTKGPQQIVQLSGSLTPLYVVAIGALALLVALALFAARARLGAVVRNPAVQQALAFVAFNFVLHFFYRGNGQRFLFSIHVVFPLFVLLAHLRAAAPGLRGIARGLLALSLLAWTLNNAAFVEEANRLLDLRCLQEANTPMPICLRWEGARRPPTW